MRALSAAGPLRARFPWPGRGALACLGTRPRFLAMAAFLFAGDLKAEPRLAWVPVDLTLLTGGLLAAVVALRVARGARPASVPALALLGVWWLTFLPGVAGAVDSPYAFQKVGTLFTFSPLAALAPLWLLEEAGDLGRMVRAMAGFALAITLSGLLGAGTDLEAPARLQAFGAGTISLGRASGLLFILAALALEDGAPRVPAFLILALAGITALFSGSRGPIVSALLVLGLLVGVGRRGRRVEQAEDALPPRHPRAALDASASPMEAKPYSSPFIPFHPRSSPSKARLAMLRLAAAGGLAALVALSLSFAPSGSMRRLESFFRGEYGGSEQYRVQALQRCWELIPDAPAGLGWGRFATHVDPEKGLPRQYPHNLLAEVTLEGGWLCGAATLGVLAAAAAAAWSRTAAPAGRIAFAGLLFYLANAMVSGDVNDNRPLFAFIASSLALLEVRS